jgi:hypothetical protein
MAVSCDPSDLARASACYCFPRKQDSDAILIYLLAQIAENTATPAELAKAAACYCFPDQKSRDAVIAYLLCSIASSA